MSHEIHVTRSSMPPLEEYMAEIAPLWESHWLTNMGDKHAQLEGMLKEYLRIDNISLFTNGHNALECAFEAMKLRGKVITTPFTFSSTTHAIVRKGLEPIFADIRPDDCTIDPDEVRKLAKDPSVCAIVPVHVYGNLCDVDALQDIADEYNLTLIYDAAHAFGVERQNALGAWEPAASFGDASMFSFHATKVYNTIEGGAVCFRDPNLKSLLDQWKNFGITGPEDVEYIGGNAKMNEFCAAMGICNLRHLDEEIEKRRLVIERYRENLKDVKGVRILLQHSNVKSNYAYMPVTFEDEFGATRDDVFDKLAEHGIGARKYFYPLVSDYACYKGRFNSMETPIAKDIASRVLTLPLYSDLPMELVDKICDIILDCSRKGVHHV